MKFYKEVEWNSTWYTGRAKGFEFTISGAPGDLYHVVASHRKKDIRFNTLWSQLAFKTLEEAQQFCEDFHWQRYACIGEDAIR